MFTIVHVGHAPYTVSAKLLQPYYTTLFLEYSSSTSKCRNYIEKIVLYMFVRKLETYNSAAAASSSSVEDDAPGELANLSVGVFAEFRAAATPLPKLWGRAWVPSTWVAFLALSSTNVPRIFEQSGPSWIKRMSLVASALRFT